MDYKKELDASVAAFRKAARNVQVTDSSIITRKGQTLFVVNRERASEARITLNADGYIGGRRLA